MLLAITVITPSFTALGQGQTLWAQVGSSPKIGDAGTRPLGVGCVADPLETHYSPHDSTPNFVALRQTIFGIVGVSKILGGTEAQPIGWGHG